MSKLKTYYCPHCEEEQTTAIAVKNVDKSYVYYLETEEFVEDNDYEGDNNFEYLCPTCHQNLPSVITNNFYY